MVARLCQTGDEREFSKINLPLVSPDAPRKNTEGVDCSEEPIWNASYEQKLIYVVASLVDMALHCLGSQASTFLYSFRHATLPLIHIQDTSSSDRLINEWRKTILVIFHVRSSLPEHFRSTIFLASLDRPMWALKKTGTTIGCRELPNADLSRASYGGSGQWRRLSTTTNRSIQYSRTVKDMTEEGYPIKILANDGVFSAHCPVAPVDQSA